MIGRHHRALRGVNEISVKIGPSGLWRMLRITKCELSGVSPPQSQYQACGWRVGVWGGCAASPENGDSAVLLDLRIWELTPQRLEATFLLPPLLPSLGIYVCAKCGHELFSSLSKYAHSSPWPAFTETIHADSVAKRPEHNQPEALKVSCGRCGNGLGHEFQNDGPKKGQSRF